MDNLKLLMGRSILFNKEHSLYVHQPLMRDIVDMGEDQFNDLLLPFTLTSEAVFNGQDNGDELASKYTVFDLFFAQVEDGVYILDSVFGGKSALGVLEASLSYFLQTDNIQFLMHRKKIVVNDFVVDQAEFMKLRSIIQGVANRKDVEFEKVPKNMTDRQKGIWAKLQAGRKRKAEREAVYLQDLINYTSNGGTSYISYKEIDNMTYFQLANTYKSIMGKDSFNVSMGYKLSYKYDVKDEIKHWSETLRIGK
ncbi:AMP-binding protein [Priestia megaterium]|uniref:AMP-binding protein n=1 Tax=Priestia megaterium TaxID=1404 RepID=UPI002FFFF452